MLTAIFQKGAATVAAVPELADLPELPHQTILLGKYEIGECSLAALTILRPPLTGYRTDQKISFNPNCMILGL